MKTKIACLFALVIACLVTPVHAQTNSTPPPAVAADAGPQFTAADVAKLDAGVNSLLPYVPASERPLALKLIGILGALAFAGRVYVGWKNNGLPGVISGLFGGTNLPKVVSDNAPSKPFLPPRQAGLILCLCLGAFVFTGCAGQRQYVDNESGTGLKAKIPVGYNGNNIFELDLTVGTFKHTTMIQPVETNRVYTPSLVVAASTRGKFIANAMNTGTNSTATVTGGDAYVINTGHAASGETNDTDLTTETWQDAPPSQAGK